MPRRQRFKPSRKAKPAIELDSDVGADADVIIPVSKPAEQPSAEQRSHQLEGASR